MRRTNALRMAAAAAALSLAVAGCTGTEGASGGTTKGGRVAFLDYGDFGGGSNPQANYNPYLIATRLGAVDYVYEKLMLIDNYSCELKPWLATSYKWTDPKTLVFTLRDGVKWTDGQPFTATDVKFSFDLLAEHAPLDYDGVSQFLTGVDATDPKTVTMHFKSPGASAFTVINDIFIVPEHIWSKVKDPETFTNAKNPVGTGPMKIKAFNPQQLTIARNPDYWQADKVKVDEIRFHKADGGGQVEQLKLSRGQYDTNAMYVPNIKKAYVDRDPEHNHYWYAPGGAISVYMNLTKAPFGDVNLRRALVYAFDKDQIAQKAELGYVETASQTGLVIPGQDDWLPSTIANKGKMAFDQSKADSMLTAAGYKKDSQGRRLGKDGKPISFTFKVPGSFTDWVAAARIVVKNFTSLGFQVNLQTPTPESYDADKKVGDYDALFGVHGGSCNMFRNFQEPLGSSQSAPIGKEANSNFVRWNDPQTDKLLDQLRLATTESDQKKAVAGLTDLMVDQVPMIDLWYGAKWFQYSTKRAVGWPNEKDPFSSGGDNLIVLTHLRPAS